MLKSVLLLVLFSHAVMSSNFLISEIFANAPGRARDSNKEWIELYNLKSPLSISSVGLEIYEQKGKTLRLMTKENFEPKNPLIFDKFMIIAQSADLGINACIDQEIPLALMDFSIKNQVTQKICVVLNHDVRTCASFSSNRPMPDGTGFFRELYDTGEDPLWRYEPCHFMNGIFATPGRPPRYFCEKHEEQNQCLPGQMVKFTPIKEGEQGPNVFTLCKALKESKKSCHMMDRRISTNMESGFLAEKYLLMPDEELFLLTKGFDGLVLKSQMTGALPIKKWPTLSVINQDEKYRLAMNLDALHLPLNLALLDKNGQILWQEAFIEQGYKTIELPEKSDLWAQLSDIHGEHLSMPLATKAKTH